jgi:dolichol-phosphate mannosyltransferase
MNLAQHKKTVTIFIPAFNEEKNIEGAVESALNVVKTRSADYEIIILDAFSSDKTGEIADRLASENKNIRVIHRKKWLGLGANYMEGARQASMDYFVLFPGDNEISGDSLSESLALLSETDIIIPYTMNTEVRAPHRRIISKAFVILLNTLFNLKLRYYNGNAVYKTKVLKNLTINSQDFAYNAEILIKLIKSGHSYLETGMKIKPITNKTALFNIRNIFGVIKTISLLFYDVNIKNR